MTPELVSLLPVRGAGSWSVGVRSTELCPLRRHGGRSEFDASTAEVTAATRRLVSANLEHDLATLPAARDSLERRLGLRERKNRVDLRAKLACVHEQSQLQQLLVVGFDDEVDRARH